MILLLKVRAQQPSFIVATSYHRLSLRATGPPLYCEESKYVYNSWGWHKRVIYMTLMDF